MKGKKALSARGKRERNKAGGEAESLNVTEAGDIGSDKTTRRAV